MVIRYPAEPTEIERSFATSLRMPVITKVPVPIAKVPEARTRIRKFTTRHGRAPARQSPEPSGLTFVDAAGDAWRSLPDRAFALRFPRATPDIRNWGSCEGQ